MAPTSKDKAAKGRGPDNRLCRVTHIDRGEAKERVTLVHKFWDDLPAMQSASRKWPAGYRIVIEILHDDEWQGGSDE